MSRVTQTQVQTLRKRVAHLRKEARSHAEQARQLKESQRVLAHNCEHYRQRLVGADAQVAKLVDSEFTAQLQLEHANQRLASAASLERAAFHKAGVFRQQLGKAERRAEVFRTACISLVLAGVLLLLAWAVLS